MRTSLTRWPIVKHGLLRAAGMLLVAGAVAGVLFVKEQTRPGPEYFQHVPPDRALSTVEVGNKLPGGIWVRSRPAKPTVHERDPLSDLRPRWIGELQARPKLKEGLQLMAAPEEAVIYDEETAGMVVYLLNVQNEPVVLTAEDGRLSVVQEARNADGEWRAIEYLTPSYCGNSYHSVTLEAFDGWRRPVRRYEGSFATELRLRFLRGGDADLISNVWKGSIDPRKFGTAPPQMAGQ